MMQAGPNRIDRGMKAVKITLWLHSNDTCTIRTTKTAQEKTFMQIIKIGPYIAMSPYPGRSTSWASIRFGPIEIATLSANILELCTNEKYHFYVFSWSGKPAFGSGGPVGQPTPHFSNKKTSMSEAHLF
jgi:hypothetical protein